MKKTLGLTSQDKTKEELMADLLILNANQKQKEKLDEKKEMELISSLISHISEEEKKKGQREQKSDSYEFFALLYGNARKNGNRQLIKQIQVAYKAAYTEPALKEGITRIENDILSSWESQKKEVIKEEGEDDYSIRELRQTGTRIDGIVSYHEDRDNKVMIGKKFYDVNFPDNPNPNARDVMIALEKCHLKIAFEAAIESGMFKGREYRNQRLRELITKEDFYAENGSVEENSNAKRTVKVVAEILKMLKKHDVDDLKADKDYERFIKFDELYQEKTKEAGLFSGRTKGFSLYIEIDGVKNVRYDLIDRNGNINSEPNKSDGSGSRLLCTFDQMMRGERSVNPDNIKHAGRLIEKYITTFGNRATYFPSEYIAKMELPQPQLPTEASEVSIERHVRRSYVDSQEEDIQKTRERNSAMSDILNTIRKNSEMDGGVPTIKNMLRVMRRLSGWGPPLREESSGVSYEAGVSYDPNITPSSGEAEAIFGTRQETRATESTTTASKATTASKIFRRLSGMVSRS